MNKAVFLDRDGVVNREIGNYITSLADFEINPDVIETLKEFKQKGYLLIVITNQGGIAKGMYTHQTLSEIHNKMEEAIAANGIELDDIYYCPHHPDFTNCLCRKPLSLLLEKAMAKYKISPAMSYFIGDHERDMTAGHAVGVNSIKVASNQSLFTIKHLIK